MIGSAYQTETRTPLAAAGPFSGATRSAGDSPSDFVYFVAESFSDQAGTLFVEKSEDGTTWFPVNGTAGATATANVTTTVRAAVTARYYRARYVNGATLQGSFNIMTAFVSA